MKLVISLGFLLLCNFMWGQNTTSLEIVSLGDNLFHNHHIFPQTKYDVYDRMVDNEVLLVDSILYRSLNPNRTNPDSLFVDRRYNSLDGDWAGCTRCDSEHSLYAVGDVEHCVDGWHVARSAAGFAIW